MCEAVRARQQRGEPDGRLIGLGFAAFYEQTAYGTGPFGYSGWGIELVPGLEPATARLTGDGELVVEIGMHSQGQGHETTFAQIAAEILGIDLEKITVRYGDTSIAPTGTGTYTSRSTVSGGGAVATACRQLDEANQAHRRPSVAGEGGRGRVAGRQGGVGERQRFASPRSVVLGITTLKNCRPTSIRRG